jgi:uncharacterized membrane protein (DUF106 family)
MMSMLSAIPWYAWVAIIAIIGGVISGIVSQIINHRERMAMIERGMNPYATDDEVPKTPLGEL